MYYSLYILQDKDMFITYYCQYVKTNHLDIILKCQPRQSEKTGIKTDNEPPPPPPYILHVFSCSIVVQSLLGQSVDNYYYFF